MVHSITGIHHTWYITYMVQRASKHTTVIMDAGNINAYNCAYGFKKHQNIQLWLWLQAASKHTTVIVDSGHIKTYTFDYGFKKHQNIQL